MAVISTTERQRAAAHDRKRATLSVCCMTAGPAARVAALLAPLRNAADEIVVALDERAAPDVHDAVASVADRILIYPYGDPVDRPIPWLHSQCHGDWVLNLDDDEVASPELVAALPTLIDVGDVTHYWIPRRWLFPDADSFLDEAPWRPDYQLRFVRNDPRLLRFSADLHRPLAVLGPARFLELPVWHLACIVQSREEREAKARKYERLRPGLRVGGLGLNAAYFVPERRPDARRAPVPAADRVAIEAVLSSAPPERTAHEPKVRRATRAEIDRLWPGRPFTDASYRARLELLDPHVRVSTGEQRAIDVRVTNDGDETWSWGNTGEPAVRLAARWQGETDALWTPLPVDLPPGAAAIVPVHFRAPDLPGLRRLEVDLVHENVRWFGCGLTLEVDVVPSRRVAIVGGDDAAAEVLPTLERYPQLEPVLVARDEQLPHEPPGHTRVPGVRSYLFGGDPDQPGSLRLLTTVIRRSRALVRREHLPTDASACVDALGRCRLLVIAGLDAPEAAPPPRELARVAAIASVARAAGVDVAVRRNALPSSGRPLVRALRRLVTSRATLVYSDVGELEDLLARLAAA